MIKFNLKFLIAGLILVGAAFLVIFNAGPAYTQSFSDVQGWAWADTPGQNSSVGWISFSGVTTGDNTPYSVNIDNSGGDMSGYAWSEHFGWLSFNTSELGGCPSGTCEAHFDISSKKMTGWAKFLATGPGFDGWVQLSGSAGGTDFGPVFNPSTKEFSDWAWGGDIVGWISFSCENAGENCGQSNYRVSTTFSNSLFVDLEAKQSGGAWFQALTGNEPFNDIDLRGSVSGNASGSMNYTFYCNRADSGTNITSGWDAQVLGTNNQTRTETNLCDYGTAGTYTAKVIVERDSLAAEDRTVITVDPPLNNAPTSVGHAVTDGLSCINPLQPTLSWTFSDPDAGDTQSAYQVQIDDSPSFNSPEVDTGKVTSSSGAYTVSTGQLVFNESYNWRVDVWDQVDANSGFIEGQNFSTQVHASPDPDFIFSPLEPIAEETTIFTDQSTVYGGSTVQSYAWTFQDGTPSSSSAAGPAVVFNSNGAKTVNLAITDSDNLTCSVDKIVTVTLPVPQFREVSP